MLFEYVHMPLGLRNTAQTFQILIDYAVRGLPFCLANLDNFLVASVNAEQQKVHLLALFLRLQKYVVIIDSVESEFGVVASEFLGLRLTSKRMQPLPPRSRRSQSFHLLHPNIRLVDFRGSSSSTGIL